jgi:hypothetical protein
MDIKLIHKLSNLPLTLKTSHNDPDDPVRVKMFGENLIMNIFTREVLSTSGHYGHSMRFPETTNLDIRAAVHHVPSFKIVSMTPEIKARPDFPPEGAQS